jgi:hypothetical protein
MALPSDLAGLRINITFPPGRGSVFGAKLAIDSRSSGRLQVQAIVRIVEGNAPDFLVAKVVQGSDKFWHKVAVFCEPHMDQLTGLVTCAKALLFKDT